MGQDVLQKLSDAVGHPVQTVKLTPEQKQKAGAVKQESQQDRLEKVLGHPIKTAQLSPLTASRYTIFSRAMANGYDTQSAVKAAVQTGAGLTQAKPESWWQRAYSAFGKTSVGSTVEGNISRLEKMWHNADQTSSQVLGMNPKELAKFNQKQKKFINEAVPAYLELHGINLPGKAQKLAAGAVRGGAELGESFTSPQQVLLLAGTFGESALEEAGASAAGEAGASAGRTLGRLAQLQFTAQAVHGSYDAAKKTAEDIKSGNWEATGADAVQTLGNILMAHGMVSHEAAMEKVRGDLETKAREMYGVPGEGVKAAVTSRFQQLDPYQQAMVIDATVKSSPVYSNYLKSMDEAEQNAKKAAVDKHQRRLREYYSAAVAQSHHPEVIERAMRGLEKGRAARARMEETSARQAAMKEYVEGLRKQHEERMAQARQSRSDNAIERARARVQRDKQAQELSARREKIASQRQESEAATPPEDRRHVEAVETKDGDIVYPATYWGEEHNFGVAADSGGSAVYRQTPRGFEWMDADGNFSAEPENLFEAPDPQTADTVARLSALSTDADSRADEDGATPEQKKDANNLAAIRADLVAGDIDAREAQKRARIDAAIRLPDEFTDAREGNLTGPFADQNPAAYLDDYRQQIKEADPEISDEDLDEMVKEAPLLARRQTENNLDHIQRSGDYIISRRGVRWTLGSDGLLHPNDGGSAVPFMKRGEYSEPAIRLAESGKIGYGTETREQRRIRAARDRQVAAAVREHREQVAHEIRLAAQRQGLKETGPEEPRADQTEKQARKARRMNRPPTAPSPFARQLWQKVVLSPPADPNSVISTIARQNDTTPEEVMRQFQANDPSLNGTPQQKAAGLQPGDKIKEAIRKTPWVVVQNSDGTLSLRSGQAQPVPLDRLNPSATVLGILNRGEIEREISPQELRKVAFEHPHYVRYQQEATKAVEDRVQGVTSEPEPRTEPEAKAQSQVADQRAKAVESAAAIETIAALNPEEKTEEQALAAVEQAEQATKIAEHGFAQSAEAFSKTVPKGDFPQRAPITIGIRGYSGEVIQNGVKIPFHYELVPTDSVTPSHVWRGVKLEINPEYPESLQPRTISEAEAKVIDQRATPKNYNFPEYGDMTVSGQMGPTIVEPGGFPAGGNVRWNTMLRHLEYLRGIADDDERDVALANFRDKMRQFALKCGITNYPPSDVDYTVVRMMDHPIKDTREAADLGRLLNKPVSTQMSDAALGVSYAKSINDDLMKEIAQRIDGNDGLGAAMRADPEFFRDIVLNNFGVKDTEYVNWFEESERGLRLHKVGQDKFAKALLGKAIHDNTVLSAIDGKTPYRALERAIGPVLKLQGLGDKNIFNKVVQAVRAASQTIGTDPNLSASRDPWLATYRPEQTDMIGMERELPPEPDRMVETLWRSLHASNAAVPTTFYKALQDYIGGESLQGGQLFGASEPTPSEAFNGAFRRQLLEVQRSRGDEKEGFTQNEFDALRRDEEPGPEQPAEETRKEKEPAAAEEEPTSVVSAPPSKPEEALAAAKTEQGYVTPAQLKEFLQTNPATKAHASDLYRIADMMARYVAEDEGIDPKDALAWVLRERLARIETGELKTKRGEYSDPNLEATLGDKIMKLHKAADPSTFIHEFAHVIFPMLSDEDMQEINTVRGDERAPRWDGKTKSLKGEVYAAMSEKFARSLERFLREQNPTDFSSPMKNILARTKAMMRKVYMAFKSDPLYAHEQTSESRAVFAKMFGITGFDEPDVWREELDKARAEKRKLKKPSEAPHPLQAMASDLGAKGIANSMHGKIEDSIGGRIDPRKPVAVFLFGNKEDAATAAWSMIAKPGSKIEDAELIQNPEGEWGIKINAKSKPPTAILDQPLPEKHPGIELEELQDRLLQLRPSQELQRKLLQLKIDNLKNRIRAEYGAEELNQKEEPGLAASAREEIKNARADNGRSPADVVPGVHKPERTSGIPKPPKLGMPRYERSAESRAARTGEQQRVPRSLAEIPDVKLEPLPNPRGNPVGTVKGEAYDEDKWRSALRTAGLPDTVPPPTHALDEKTAQILKFPGQKQVVQIAMSALKQGDGVVIATATGTGKSYTAMGTIREFRMEHPDARILHITKNRGLLKDAQKVAANSFGFHLEDEPAGADPAPGVYGATYMGLINDKSYADVPWDLVVADESGEARNWHREENQQGKMLRKTISNSKKALYLSATPFHSPMEYGYLDKLGLWPKNGFDKWIQDNFAHEKIKDKVIARIDPPKQAKLRQQLIERGQLVSQAISYDGFTAHFGIVPVTDEMRRSLDRIHEGFQRARQGLLRKGKKGLAERTAALEATYTKAYLERQMLPQNIEIARKAREAGWHVILSSETSSEDMFRRDRDENAEPLTFQELDDEMGGILSKMIPPYENVFDRLKAAFGDDIVDYSGRGNSLAAREQAKNDFLAGKAPMLYTTYAAGGIGVSLHDADYPDLNVLGGDKPRVVIALGAPYSGVLFEQWLGRAWRFGTKSDVHAVILTTDAEPDVRLMQTKVGPRLRGLRAAVLGEKDSLAHVMSTYSEEQRDRERQDMMAYADGNEMKVNAQSFTKRSRGREVGLQDWNSIHFPSAEDAKNKGMKYGEAVPDDNFARLFQDNGPMSLPDGKDEVAAKKAINAIANAAISGKLPDLSDQEPADRRNTVEAISATAVVESELPVDRDKFNVAKSSMMSGSREGAIIPYMGISLTQEQGIVNIARLDGKPEVGHNLRRMNRAYHADWDNYVGNRWTELDRLFKKYKLKPDDDVMRQVWDINEGKLSSADENVMHLAKDISDMMVKAHGDLASAGVVVHAKDGRTIPYAKFDADPGYMPHRIDWAYKMVDPKTGDRVAVRDFLKIDQKKQQRIIDAVPELKKYSRQQIVDFLAAKDPKAPLQSNVHFTRDIDFPFIKKDYKTLLSYFDQAGQSIGAAKNFGSDEGLLRNEIQKLSKISDRETVASMFRAALHKQDWNGLSAKLYNAAVAYEVYSKMTFSAAKVPFHLVLAPLTMKGRMMPLLEAIGRTALHPKEVMERAAFVGTTIRQTNASELMFGEHTGPSVRTALKMEMFESAYKMVRAISGESARCYLENHALHDLRKGGAGADHTRRMLRDVFLIGDHGVDQAIANGHFEKEDMDKAQTAFANMASFSATGDPLQMPAAARMEIPVGSSNVEATLKRAVRLSYSLQSFGVRTASLIREHLWDEVMVHKNPKPLMYAIVAFPAVGTALNLTGTGVKHFVQSGIEGLERKKHTQDSWDKYIAYLSDTFEHPTAAKFLKWYVDSWALSAALETMKTMADPLIDLASGNWKKSDNYWTSDIAQHLLGPFYSDLWDFPKEALQLERIHAAKKTTPEHKKEATERSLVKFVTNQVPALRTIPQTDKIIAKPPKARREYWGQ